MKRRNAGAIESLIEQKIKNNISNDYRETRVDGMKWENFQTSLYGSFGFWLDNVGSWKILSTGDNSDGQGDEANFWQTRWKFMAKLQLYVRQQQIDQLVARQHEVIFNINANLQCADEKSRRQYVRDILQQPADVSVSIVKWKVFSTHAR